MNDLYGQQIQPSPATPFSLDDAVRYMPNFNGPITSPQEYYRQLPQPAPVAPSAPAQQPVRPQQPPFQFLSWPAFQAMNKDLDPEQVYDTYINNVVPIQASALGYTPEQVEEAKANFLKANPRPVKQVAEKAPVQQSGWEAAKKEFQAGIESYKAGMAAIPAALGSEDWKQTYLELKDKADALRKESNAPGSFEDVKSISDFLPYLRQLAFGSLPYAAEFVVGAGVGGLAMRAISGTAKAAAVNALKVVAEQGAESVAAKAAVKEAADAASKLATRVTAIGAATTYPSSVGQVLSAQDEQNKNMNIAVAASLGVPYAALNAFGGVEALLGRMFAGGVEGLGKSGIKNALARTATGALVTGTQEGAQEVGQQILEELGRAQADPNYKIENPEVLKRLKESFVGGFFLGAVPGAGAGLLRRHEGIAKPGEEETPPPPPAVERGEEKPILSEAELAGEEQSPAPPAPLGAAVATEETPTESSISQEERQSLYEKVAMADNRQGLLDSLGITKKFGKEVNEALDAVVEAENPEDKVAGLRRVAELTKSPELRDAADLTARQYDLNAGVARFLANDLATEIINEAATKSEETLAQTAGVETKPAEPTATTAATTPTATGIPGEPVATGAIQQATGQPAQAEPTGRNRANRLKKELQQGAYTEPGVLQSGGVVAPNNELAPARPNVSGTTTGGAATPQRQRGLKLGKVDVEEQNRNFYLRRLEELGFDKKTAVENYDEDPAYWREVVDKEAELAPQRVAGSKLSKAEIDALANEDENIQPAIARGAIKYLEPNKYLYHAVRNDADISHILNNGLEPGTNVSTHIRGQAFEDEGATILVYNKEDYKHRSKGYQEDSVISNNSKQKPVAILKDTSVQERPSYDEVTSRIEKEWNVIEEENRRLQDITGLSKEELNRLKIQATTREGYKEAKRKLGEDFDRVRAAAKKEDSLFALMDRQPEEGAPAVTQKDVLANYDKYGIPVYALPSINQPSINRNLPYSTYDVVYNGPSGTSYGLTNGQVVGSYTNRNRARNKADQLDEQYGASIHTVKERTVVPNESSVNFVRTGVAAEVSHEALVWAIADNKPKDALAFIEKNYPGPRGLIAKFLIANKIFPKTEIGDALGNLGIYKSAEDAVTLSDKIFTPERILPEGPANRNNKWVNDIYRTNLVDTFLHEVVHAATVNELTGAYRLYHLERVINSELALDKNGQLHAYDKYTGIKLSDDLGFANKQQHQEEIEKVKQEALDLYNNVDRDKYAAARRIFQIFDYLKNSDPEFSKHYGGKNPLELVSEAFSNDEFQNYLKRTILPEGLRSQKRQSIWGAFVGALKRLLGITDKDVGTALEQILNDVSTVARERDVVNGEVQLNRANPEEIRGSAWMYHFYGKAAEENAAPRAKLDKALKEAAAKSETKDKQIENELKRTPRNAYIANDVNTGERRHIAYPRENGLYDLYEVTEPTTKEGVRGDPDTRQANLTEAQVKRQMGGENVVLTKNEGLAFGGPPKNTATQIVRWQDGKWVFAAYKQSDGMWSVYRSNDLHNKNEPRTAAKGIENVEKVQDMYANDNLSKTYKQSLAKQQQEQTQNLLKVGINLPNKININLFDANAPAKYLGFQVSQALEAINRALPEGLRLDYQYILKNSAAQKIIDAGFDREIPPLRDAGRKLMKEFGWNEKRLSDLHVDLVVAERFPKVMRFYTPEARAKLGAANQQKVADANARLSQLSPYQRDKLEAYAKEWKKFSDATVDLRRNYGLISDETATKIKRAYTYYAPLGEDRPVPTRGTTAQSATGESIYSKMMQERADTVTRGVDNQVKNVLLKLLQDYVSPYDKATNEPLFTVSPVVEFRRNLGTGMVEEVTDPGFTNPNSILVMVDGSPTRIIVNNKDMLRALDAFPKRERNTVIQKMIAGSAMFNYLYGATKTLLSPVFGVKNYLRDNFTTFAQLDPGISYGNFIAASLNPEVWTAAIREAMHSVAPSLMQGNGYGAALAREAKNNGAFISRKHMLGLDQLDHDVKTNLSPTMWGYVKEAGSLEGPLFGFLSTFTKVLENATRLSIYKAGIDSGLSPVRAAIAGKTGTVNFEPKGDLSSTFINPAYVFANAKMQGVRTLMQNIGAMPGVQKANRRTQAAAVGALAFGMLAGWMLWSNSDKDKDGKRRAGKIPDYKRDNFIIVNENTPGAPIPQELGFFYVLGNSIADYMFGDKLNKFQAANARWVTNAVQNFWPSGSAQYDPIGYNARGSDYLIRMLLPTPAMMIYDISTNRNTFGSEIVRNKQRQLDSGIPLSEMGSPRNSSPLARGAARTAAPVFESAPQQWDYFAKQFVGPQMNLMRWITGAEPQYPGQRVNPFTAQFMPDVSPYIDRENYNEAKTDVENAYIRWKRADLADKPKIYEDNKNLIQIRPQIHSIDGKISELFKRLSKMPAEERAKREKAVDEMATELRTRAMKQYYEAKEAQSQ